MSGLDDHPHGEAVIDRLTGVVHGDEGTGRKAAVLGTTIAGKSGPYLLNDNTVLASFVGIVPAEAPAGPSPRRSRTRSPPVGEGTHAATQPPRWEVPPNP